MKATVRNVVVVHSDSDPGRGGAGIALPRNLSLITFMYEML